MSEPDKAVRWGALWRSRDRLDGVVEHLIYRDDLPILFQTQREARDWISANYGYIRHRKDLLAEPRGWRVPRVVRVQATYTVLEP
jgi:hypothetical protein